MNIEHQPGTGKGRFLATEDGKEMGELTYFLSGENQVTIDHTLGFPGSQGKGVGVQLMNAAVAVARGKGWRIIPECSFIRKMMDRFPEDYKDVRA